MATKKTSSDERRAANFSQHLETLAQKSPKQRDREKTRYLLLASAVRFSEAGSFATMTVKDVVKGAGTSHGAFYLYFKSAEAIAVEALSEFVDFEVRTMPVFDAALHPFDARIAMVRWYQTGFKSNIGLMRNMVLLSDTVPEIAEIWRRRGKLIVDRFLDYYRLRFDLTDEELNLLRIAHHAVGSMSDHSLFARYGVHGASETSQERDEELLIELHATLSYRAIFGEDPPSDRLKRAAAFTRIAEKLR
jgi:AcrR family transcriptional regulator